MNPKIYILIIGDDPVAVYTSRRNAQIQLNKVEEFHENARVVAGLVLNSHRTLKKAMGVEEPNTDKIVQMLTDAENEREAEEVLTEMEEHMKEDDDHEPYASRDEEEEWEVDS